ncbi:MAG: GGDEF domain-containing protein [Bradyrhizobiaceae bacterium]|nr:GGDEF domain-containing protein [Bradyrhizobiaceae bacterium]
MWDKGRWDRGRRLAISSLILLLAEAALYFGVMATLFRLRRQFGLGVFVCALGSLHFLETYLAAIFYIQAPFGTALSPGSIVLFSGKLVMLLLLYIREDAEAVRQPIYGLLFGNFLIVALVMVMRQHNMVTPVPGQFPDFPFLDQMGGLMIWGTVLLFVDSILLILLYERSAAWLGRNVTARIWLSASAVLTLDQVGFYLALYTFVGSPIEVFYGGWIGKMVAAAIFALFTGAYLRWFESEGGKLELRPRLADVFDALTYRERYQALLEQTGRDGLTGLYDRGRLERQGPLRVADALAAGRSLSLILVDIDGFKDINDRHGHAAGDQILRLVGTKLSDTMRSTDSIYRYGGDEFVVLSEGLAHDAALAAAERVRRAVETLSAEERIPVTISIGIATCPGEATSLSELFASADARLYAAKSAGRNRVVGGPEARGARPSTGNPHSVPDLV